MLPTGPPIADQLLQWQEGTRLCKLRLVLTTMRHCMTFHILAKRCMPASRVIPANEFPDHIIFRNPVSVYSEAHSRNVWCFQIKTLQLENCASAGSNPLLSETCSMRSVLQRRWAQNLPQIVLCWYEALSKSRKSFRLFIGTYSMGCRSSAAGAGAHVQAREKWTSYLSPTY